MVSYDVIIRPIITERSMAGAADKKYVFEVAPGAGKIEIRKAVEEIFSVKVAKGLYCRPAGTAPTPSAQCQISTVRVH